MIFHQKSKSHPTEMKLPQRTVWALVNFRPRKSFGREDFLFEIISTLHTLLLFHVNPGFKISETTGEAECPPPARHSPESYIT